MRAALFISAWSRSCGDWRRDIARKIPAFQRTDLLFLDIRELVAGIADPAVIETRRHRYMENAEYLSLHGVDNRRLETMLNDL